MTRVAVKIARSAGIVALFLLAAGLGIASGVMFAYSGDMPQISELDDYAPSTITRVYAPERRGRRRVRHPAARGHPLRGDLAEAAAGDPRRRRRRVRAALRPEHPAHRCHADEDIAERRKAGGASTLTQQLARKLFLTDEKTWERKIREAILAIQIEKRYTKREIFTLYANQMYFGHGVYGVEAASRLYFGKSAKDLELRGGRADRRHPPEQRPPEPVREHGGGAAAAQLHARPHGRRRASSRPQRPRPRRSSRSSRAGSRPLRLGRAVLPRRGPQGAGTAATARSSSTRTACRSRPASTSKLQEAANRALDGGAAAHRQAARLAQARAQRRRRGAPDRHLPARALGPRHGEWPHRAGRRQRRRCGRDPRARGCARRDDRPQGLRVDAAQPPRSSSSRAT